MYIYLYTGDGEIYIWDMSERKCIQKFHDIGNLRGNTIACSQHGFATGYVKKKGNKELRINLVFSDDAGVVNIYQAITQLKGKTPHPSKSLMNLTTAITEMKFNHDGQILGIASRSKKNAFRLVRCDRLFMIQFHFQNGL